MCNDLNSENIQLVDVPGPGPSTLNRPVQHFKPVDGKFGRAFSLFRAGRQLPTKAGRFVAADELVVGTGPNAKIPIASMTDMFQKNVLLAIENVQPMVVMMLQTHDVTYSQEMLDLIGRAQGRLQVAHVASMMSVHGMDTEFGFDSDGVTYVSHIAVGGTEWWMQSTWSHDQQGWMLDAKSINNSVKVFPGVRICQGIQLARHPIS